jgi:hypothetical protein
LPQPGYPDAVPDRKTPARRPKPFDDAHDLMTWDDPGLLRCEIALADVQIRSAHPARPDPDENLAGTGYRLRPLGHSQGIGLDRSRFWKRYRAQMGNLSIRE